MAIQDILKKNAKIGPILVFVVSLIIVGAFVYKVYLPKSVEITALNEEIDSVNTQYEQASAKARKLIEVQKAKERLEQELAKATEKLPSEKETKDLMETLSEMIDDAGLDKNEGSQGPTLAMEGNLYKQFSFSFKTAGTFHNMGRFMEALDSERRLIRVSSMNMSVGTVKGREMVIPADINIIAYSSVEGEKK
jgi:Tfp pilus assembly protein PilO